MIRATIPPAAAGFACSPAGAKPAKLATEVERAKPDNAQTFRPLHQDVDSRTRAGFLIDSRDNAPVAKAEIASNLL
jgi:hypothetical protein